MRADAARILIIDDEVGMREGCRRALQPHGFQVVTAEHGADGLHKLREGAFDLALIDVMMPGMSGLELLEHIQEHCQDTICVMITGYATVDLASRAMKQGAHDFLPKPFTSDELLTMVNRGLSERQRRLELRRREVAEEEAHQLERARQEMAKLDAIQSRFMLVIAHELRNPAGVLKNYLQLMRAGYVDDDEWEEYLEKLDLRADQLLSMLDDILELAYLKEQPSPSKLEPVDVAVILEEVARQLEPQVAAKGLEFSRQIQARPTMQAQAADLRSLWSNLLDNAIKYTPKGRIAVTLSVEDGQVVVQIMDTGIGISTEELSRVFQEFYRSDAAKEEVPLGTGLGLPIVNQIVKNYQGAIEVDSTPGQGSTFTVRLPTDATDSRS